MTQIRENSKMSEDFFRCRPQLVHFCRSLTGDADAAEDLAQETLAEAWRCRDNQRDLDKTEAWLFGIADNVCRRHFRRLAQVQEQAVREAPETDGGSWDTHGRHERAALLNQALDFLPDASRTLLTGRYFDEMALAEIAAQAQSSENTAAVRLARARAALRTVLSTCLRAETATLGLLPNTPSWLPTRVWCFRCGARHLEERRELGGFQVRCPLCDSGGADIAFSTNHAAMNSAHVLGQVQSCKPALRRINAWWDVQLQRGLTAGTLPCWKCAASMTRTTRSGDGLPSRALFQCGRCGAEFSLPASGLAFHSVRVQEFWQKHPRLRVRPERRIQIDRRPAVVTRFEAIGSTAVTESVYDAQTFRRIK